MKEVYKEGGLQGNGNFGGPGALNDVDIDVNGPGGGGSGQKEEDEEEEEVY